MFSLLLSEQKFAANETASKGAFKVNMLNIPVCCDTVCSHTFLGPLFEPRIVPCVSTLSSEGPEREY